MISQGLKKYLLFPLIIVLVLLAFFVFKTNTPEHPGVNLEPANWSLEEVELGKNFSASVKIKNNSIVKYEIVKVRPSCECITAKITQNIADKYSDGIVDVEITAKKELGTHFKAFVYINLQEIDGEKEPAILKFDISGSIKGSKYDLKDTEILLFRNQKAGNYEIVQEKLQLLKQKYPELKIREYLLDNTDNYRLLAIYEKEFSVKERDNIQMFKGNYYFTGNEVLRELNKLLSSGQITFEPSENALQILFFYSSVCKECRDVRENILPELRTKYRSKINVKELDILERENYEQLVAFEDAHKIEANKLMSVFLGNEYILGKFQIEKNLDSAISRLLENPGKANLTVPVKKYGSIKEKFQKFGVLAVVLAGLQDGINPCVFATIIFFISFLTFAERTRKEILCIGIFYILTVFTTYLLLGIGFFKVVQTLSAYETFSKVLFIITVILVFLFAVLSLYDLIIYWKTKQSKNILLQLPLPLKQRIHAIIRTNVKLRGLIIGAIVIGFLVTLFEAVCTGQVYLPTIVFMLNDHQIKNQAISYLLLYNLMFILPLIAVFVLAFLGVSSQKFSEFSQKNIILVKASLALFFIGIGIALLLA